MEGLTSKATILVLFANTYNMLNEKQEQLKGCTVHYMFWGEYGEKLMQQSEWNIEKPVGVQRAKCSIDYDWRTNIPIAPALYEGTFEMVVGGDGKPVLKLKEIAYVSNVTIRPKVLPGLSVPGMVSEQRQSEIVNAGTAEEGLKPGTKEEKAK